jgi:hypothetical protein
LLNNSGFFQRYHFAELRSAGQPGAAAATLELVKPGLRANSSTLVTKYSLPQNRKNLADAILRSGRID